MLQPLVLGNKGKPCGDWSLYDELTADIAATDIVIQPETPDTEREFGAVLEVLFANTANLYPH
jgi:hypothetical protein